METIGLKQLQEIVSDCLTNPDKYAGKSIVLWDGYCDQDSIEYQIIEECCVCYNKAHNDNQVWFKLTTIGGDLSYHIATSKVVCDREDMYGWKNRGIVLDNGIISLKPSDEEISHWLNFVNRHEYQGGALSSDWTLISCAQASGYGFTEDLFSNDCILYDFKPSVDEWAEWMEDKCDKRDLKPIVTFIKKKGSSIDLYYWGIALRALESELVDNDYEKLSQLSYDEFDDCLRSRLAFGVKGFPYDELWKLIQNNDEE